MKKTIGLITQWFPSNENPVKGCFVKDQVVALDSVFYFVIYNYQKKIKLNPFKKDKIYKVCEEMNFTEFNVVVYISPALIFLDYLNSCKSIFQGKTIDGVGTYVSRINKRIIENKAISAYEASGCDVDAFYCVDAQKEAYYLKCLSQKYSKPYVLGEHGPVPWPGSVLTDTNKFAIENADSFLAISKDKIRQMMLLNISLPRTVYVGNLVDENMFTYENRANNHIFTILIVAAHSFYKNYNMFIEVIDRLSVICDCEFNVMIVGYGANKGYSKGVKDFENKIKESNFAKKAILIPEVKHENIHTIYNQADVFVMTSIQEGQPVSAIEAACCGVPIFSTRCGGVEDYVDENIGRLFEIDDVEGMAKSLCDLIEKKIQFNPLYIRKKIIEKFGKETYILNFKTAFEDLF